MEDAKALLSQFTDEENSLRIKRRWLAGLPLTRKEERVILDSKSKSKRDFLPESFLREDDVFYETIKSFVERGFNGFIADEQQQALTLPLNINLPKDVRHLSSLLDYMTNKCLCSVAHIFTQGSVDFDKIRWKMIKLIKDYLRKMILTPNHDLFEKLSPLLKDPHSFRRSPKKFLDFSSQSYQAAVQNVLDGLDELPTLALLAMHRKVSGIRGYIPQLIRPKHGWKRDKLISSLRKTCIEMLSTTGEGVESRESLNKAMGVAVLASKLILHNHYVADLRMFSEDIQDLQMEIAKAIELLKTRVLRFPELLNKLQHLLDPGSKLSERSLRTGIRNLLTEYLFECSDMDSIPGGLRDVLYVINQKSHCASPKYFSKEDIENEVECILSVGAHIKQIVWDLPIKHEFDYDFADLYMEDLEESNDDECYFNDYIKNGPTDYSRFGSSERHDPSESITESISDNFTTGPHNAQDFCHTTQNRIYKAGLDSTQYACVNTVDSSGAFSSSLKTKKRKETQSGCVSPHSFNGRSFMKEEPINHSASNITCRDISDKKMIDKKPYMAIQGACDDTSLFTYRLLGHLMDEFARIEGLPLNLNDAAYLRCGEVNWNEDQVAKEKSYCGTDDYGSVIIQLVQQLWPSFPQSGKIKLEEIMRSS